MLTKINGYSPISNSYSQNTKTQKNPGFNAIFHISGNDLPFKKIDEFISGAYKVYSGGKTNFKQIPNEACLACEDGNDVIFLDHLKKILDGFDYDLTFINKDVFKKDASKGLNLSFVELKNLVFKKNNHITTIEGDRRLI